jgi:ubiquinone/menaquinone biosynthesis C-methylase UbiE
MRWAGSSLSKTIRTREAVSTEAKVAGHYTRGRLGEMILGAVAKAGKDSAQLTASDLAAVDEFHVGGLEATQELAKHMELRPELRLLDVGCGIGGPARYFASQHACKVTGVDLTEEFVQVAGSLTRRSKLDHLVDFHRASALALPFEEATFDRAYMIHVGMNIADKASLCREVRRVLKPDGLFTIFDIMRSGNDPLRFPVPWALTEETSFVAEVKDYRSALGAAGFRILQERSRLAFAIEFTERSMARVAQGGPPALGLHLLMGETTKPMLENILSMMRHGLIEPVELYARAV